MTPRTFQTLHNRCREKVFHAVLGYVRNRDDAEEASAQAFATAYRHRRRFRAESSFDTWVYRIAINAAISAKRRQRTVSLETLEGPPPASLIQPDVLDRVLDRDTCCRRLRMALKQIPARYRKILTDHFVRRYPTRRIAKSQGIPVGTVLSRLFTGRQLLRRAYQATDLVCDRRNLS
jgi:RNA polymerase sigma-70 factor (ECF subfamily)